MKRPQRKSSIYASGGSVDGAARELQVSVSTLSRNLKRSHFRQLAETVETMKDVFYESWR